MTPAYVLSKAYVGIVRLQRSTMQAMLAYQVESSERQLAGAGLRGWRVRTTIGTEPAPLGGVLIGAIVPQDGSDVNLYACPEDPAAAVLNDSCREAIERSEFVPSITRL